jgi:hypothetical protein
MRACLGVTTVTEPHPRTPWRAQGSGLAIPCIVPVRNAKVPPEFTLVAPAGHTLGMLVYLEYRMPSEAVHRELIWLSAIVRCTDRAYRVPDSFGPMYYVGRVYGDTPLSLSAGSRDWASHKALAHFYRRGNRIEVDAEDGTHVAFSWKPRGLVFSAPTRISTLQRGQGRVVSFRAQGRAQVQLATYKLEAFESEHHEWEGFKHRLVLPGVASHLKAFESVMHGPAEVPRRLDSIAPSPTPSLV